MGTKTKVALAGTFVGLVAMSAAAFGQTGSGREPANPRPEHLVPPLQRGAPRPTRSAPNDAAAASTDAGPSASSTARRR